MGLVGIVLGVVLALNVLAFAIRGAPAADPWSESLMHCIAFGTAILVGLGAAGEGTVSGVLGLSRFRPRMLLGLFPLAVGTSVVLSEVWNLVQERWPPSDAEVRWMVASLDPDLGTLLLVVLVAPVCEEMLFRGLVLRRLAVRYGAFPAIAFTAVAFAAIHMNPARFPDVLFAGLGLGWIARCSGSILPCIVVHGLHNAAPILLSRRVVPIPGWNAVDRVLHGQADHVPLAVVLGAVGLTAMGALVVAATSAPRVSA